jgi:beta-phosphoglucomutase-like phosphatase (HAD superfamily)
MQGLKQELKKNPPTAYIFDADLTAWDAGAVHEEGWREAGRVHGQTITAEFLEYQKGRTNEAAAEWLLGPDLYRKIGAAFIATKQDYVVQHAAQAVPYDDFLRAVAALRGVGVPVVARDGIEPPTPAFSGMSDQQLTDSLYENTRLTR